MVLLLLHVDAVKFAMTCLNTVSCTYAFDFRFSCQKIAFFVIKRDDYQFEETPASVSPKILACLSIRFGERAR